MARLMFIGLALSILAIAGCNEAEEKDEATTTPVATRAQATSPEMGGAEDAGSEAEPGSPSDASQTADGSDADLLTSVRVIVSDTATEYNLVYNEELDVLWGSGIRQEGIPLSFVAEKARQLQSDGKDNAPSLEQAVRSVLGQLEEAGSAATGENAQAPAGTAPPAPQGEAAGAELLHPMSVFGGWMSIREQHPRHTVEHSTDSYYEYIELHYEERTALFSVYRNGDLFSSTKYPAFQYDGGTGALTLLGPGDRPVETLTVWARKYDHPNFIWLQREHSESMTEYEKKDRTGEPLSQGEIEERERLSFGALLEERKKKEAEQAEKKSGE